MSLEQRTHFAVKTVCWRSPFLPQSPKIPYRCIDCLPKRMWTHRTSPAASAYAHPYQMRRTGQYPSEVTDEKGSGVTEVTPPLENTMLLSFLILLFFRPPSYHGASCFCLLSIFHDVLHSQAVVEDALAQAEVLRRDFKQLVIGEKLKALLKTELSRRDKAQRLI